VINKKLDIELLEQLDDMFDCRDVGQRVLALEELRESQMFTEEDINLIAKFYGEKLTTLVVAGGNDKSRNLFNAIIKSLDDSVAIDSKFQ